MIADLRAALALLTTLPVRYPEGRKPGYAFTYFPLVGLLVGGVVAGAAALAPVPLKGWLPLAAWVLITGGLHLDGFGDACDGLFAAVEPTRRLEIMKDPRTGTWAVVGLIVLLLGKGTLLPHVTPVLLVVPPVAGRWAMVAAAFAFPYARTQGMGGYFREGLGRPQILAASLTSLVALGVVAATVSVEALAALVVAPLVVIVIGKWAARRLGGGLTGDLYGALCELTELTCLVVFVWLIN
ncbi:adenosylcobinamide-GDP ribazoletransferase [Aggregatilinea lenta]|uniref:adenosylcobinamide-GDP ribazoletransferase n=1 Tax=Aggregatilinea lenta TaxID=913108 RepID=UPI000E5C1B89|nr:adenosylcobinamide-GDP ribazoletransferase [Aggregatilinea lenta]